MQKKCLVQINGCAYGSTGSIMQSIHTAAQQAGFEAVGHERRAVRTTALGGHVGQVRLHRLLREGKAPGDLLVRETAGDVIENLLLAQGEYRIGVGDEDHRMSLTGRP